MKKFKSTALKMTQFRCISEEFSRWKHHRVNSFTLIRVAPNYKASVISHAQSSY